MGQTSIEWTDRTWNPTRGCSRVSPGCDHCYAMREARRHDHAGGAYEGLTRIGKRGVDWSGRVRLVPEALDAPLMWRKPQRVFVNSMSDLFHESLSDEAIDQVFVVMAATFQRTRHTFQVLTKRPERMRAYMATPDRLERIYCAWRATVDWGSVEAEAWPLPNVWLGVSVESQATASKRIPLLLETPAAVRLISLEPQLEQVDLAPWLKFARFEERYRELVAQSGGEGRIPKHLRWNGVKPPALDWVIVGGESGPGARPFDVAWARSVVAQCKAAGVQVFVKQLGARPIFTHDVTWGGVNANYGWADHVTFPRGCEIKLRDRKGGDMAEWPEPLRVREFPR